MNLNSLLKPVAALALAGAVMTASVGTAEARRGHWVGAFVAGAAVATVLGAHAYSRPYYHSSGCYKGPVQCRWVGGGCWENRWGERVCRRGHEQCWRPTYCD